MAVAATNAWPRGRVGQAYLTAWPTTPVLEPEKLSSEDRTRVKRAKDGSLYWPTGTALVSGPIGSAKTRTTFTKAHLLAQAMTPSPRDGTRRFRLVVCRQTYPELWRSTIRTWHKMFPPEQYPGWKGSEPRAAEHNIRFELADGPLDFQVLFVAPGEGQSMEAFFGGFEASVIYLNELGSFDDQNTILFASGRTGRYPDAGDGELPWFGVLADFNKTDIDHWLYDFVQVPRPGLQYFDQPSGLSPDAENLENLPAGYYQRYADAPESDDPGWFNRMILNEWAPSRLGKPVHPKFRADRHVARAPIKPIRELGLVLGADQPRKPALVVMQWLAALGRWLVLDEFYDENMGAEDFGLHINRLLRERYPEWSASRIAAWIDPAAEVQGSVSDDTPIRTLRRVTGLAWRPAPGQNAWHPRFEAIDGLLRVNAEDGGPALLLSPPHRIGYDARRKVEILGGCPMLRSALAGKYCYPAIKRAGQTRFGERPIKNAHSNIVDALQAGLLGGGEYMTVLGRRQEQGEFTRPVMVAHSFNPLET